MTRAVILALATLGCSGDPAGATFPPLAGTYSATFSVTFSNLLENESASLAGTVTLHAPSSSGAFTGSYIISGAGSGIIEGVIRSDGGISISEFGDPNADPLESLQVLQNEFWWCDFAFAAGSPMSGSVDSGTLTLSGGISVPCNYVNPTRTVPSTIQFTVRATR